MLCVESSGSVKYKVSVTHKVGIFVDTPSFVISAVLVLILLTSVIFVSKAVLVAYVVDTSVLVAYVVDTSVLVAYVDATSAFLHKCLINLWCL